MDHFRKIDVVIDVVIMLLVTYYVADTLSNGEFSREVGIRFVKLYSRVRNNIERQQAVRRDTGKVIWDAIETLEHRGDAEETG
jgi:hypothetical protein